MVMGIKDQLRLIQRLSGLTQQQLAGRLGVSFAAYNRWANNKAKPRAKAQKRIDELYREYTGQKEIPEDILTAKKQAVLNKRKDHRTVLKTILANPDVRDQFMLSLTYHSNKIEGSSLTENDTAAILFQNAALPNKSLTEQMEAKNHQSALNYLFEYIGGTQKLDENFILKLHGILMNSIRDDAGLYRRHGVRIVGTNVPTANWLKVPDLMKELVKDINKSSKDVIGQVADIHSRFEKIHPLSDGNGRVGRLLMSAMLLKQNLPPAVIRQEYRQLYMRYLNKAQMKDDISNLTDFVCDAILDGYRIIERTN
jgi:Fic family protein